MSRFEILCVTMHQKDFSKIKEMNIHSDVVFANQADKTSLDEMEFEGHRAKMITTTTRGVGVNRNLALLHAQREIVLLGDDDMRYADGYAEAVVNTFDAIPDADAIIFNIHAKGGRPQKQNTATRKVGPLTRMPYGAPRIALRLEALRRSNVWFSTLFGGGCRYTNGEDSIFINQLRRTGMRIYVSPVVIGEIDMSESSWYQGADEEFFFNKGAYLKVAHPYALLLFDIYFLFRVKTELPLLTRWKWLRKGHKAYAEGRTFREAKEQKDQ